MLNQKISKICQSEIVSWSDQTYVSLSMDGQYTKLVYCDEEVFLQFKEKSKADYCRAWKAFKTFSDGHNFEQDYPSEDLLIKYFKHMREKYSTSTIWTNYSYINSILKRKYGVQLQTMPRITLTLKGFEEDVKTKAAIFEDEVYFVFLDMKITGMYRRREYSAIFHFRYYLVPKFRYSLPASYVVSNLQAILICVKYRIYWAS